MKLIQIAMFLALLGPLLILGELTKGGGYDKTSDLTPYDPYHKTPDEKKPDAKKPDDKKLDDKEPPNKKPDHEKRADKHDNGSGDKGSKRPKSPDTPEKKADDQGNKRPKPDDKKSPDSSPDPKGRKPKKPEDDHSHDENKDPNKPNDIKEIEYDCDGVPNACKNMCWGRFCRKGRIGYADFPIHFGGTDDSKDHRGPTKNGYKPPTKGNECTELKGHGGWSKDSKKETSMDEWPMASFQYDIVKDVEHSVGFRCMSPEENRKAGPKMTGHMNKGEFYKVKFKNAGKDKIGVDWCMPSRTCKNDGYQFSFHVGDQDYKIDPDVNQDQYNKESRDLLEPAHSRDFMPEVLESLKEL